MGGWKGGSLGTVGGSVGFALPGFGAAPGAGSAGFGEGPAGSLAVGVVNGVSPFPRARVHGGSTKAGTPRMQPDHRGFRAKSLARMETAGEQGLFEIGGCYVFVVCSVASC